MVHCSGTAKRPRIRARAQVSKPVDPHTVVLLCHGMGHWFGAWDIIDAAFPERSVMNYRDRTGG